MTIVTKTALISVFGCLCVTTTFAMIIYWCYQYSQDNDLSLVDYKDFSTIPQTYPVISLCFEVPFLEDKLKQIHPSINGSLYLKYLKGEVDNDILRYIDYDNVTLNILDYVGSYDVTWRNGSKSRNIKESQQEVRKMHHVTYSGFINGYLVKCFGIELNVKHMKEVSRIKNRYRKQMFQTYPDGLRPVDGSFGTHFHYPNQFLLSAQTSRYGWPKRKTNSGFYMYFRIKIIEYLRRRTKRKQPCLDSGKQFDDLVIDYANQQNGCRAPYQTNIKNLPICSGKENIKKAIFDLWENKKDKIRPPCDAILHVSDIYDEYELTNDSIAIAIKFPERVKIIQQSREITFHALVGNSGGYIGLLLGYSLLQLPGFLICLYEKIKKLSSRLSSVNANEVLEEELITNSNAMATYYAHGSQRNALFINSYLKPDNQQKMTTVQEQICELKAMFNQRTTEVERSVKSIESAIEKINAHLEI